MELGCFENLAQNLPKFYDMNSRDMAAMHNNKFETT
jgi:hypothetical protein